MTRWEGLDGTARPIVKTEVATFFYRQKNPEGAGLPESVLTFCEVLLIELHLIADVDIFQREHQHAGGSRRSDVDHHDFSHRSSWHVSYVD